MLSVLGHSIDAALEVAKGGLCRGQHVAGYNSRNVQRHAMASYYGIPPTNARKASCTGGLDQTSSPAQTWESKAKTMPKNCCT